MTLRLPESDLVEFAKGVELLASDVLEGLHRSPRGGEGIEFHSGLPYAEGEDARRIDWKRYAATDRYFVRKFKKEEKTRWHIVLDRSSSMNYGEKSLWARTWAGAIVFLAKVWGDAWCLYPDAEYDVDEALLRLAKNEVGVDDISKISLPSSGENLRWVVLSDFFWTSDLRKSALSDWSSRFWRTYLVQFLDPRELHFPFKGVHDFHDLESHDHLILDSSGIQKAYQKKLTDLQAELKWAAGEGQYCLQEVSGQQLKAGLLKFFEAIE